MSENDTECQREIELLPLGHGMQIVVGCRKVSQHVIVAVLIGRNVLSIIFSIIPVDNAWIMVCDTLRHSTTPSESMETRPNGINEGVKMGCRILG